MHQRRVFRFFSVRAACVAVLLASSPLHAEPSARAEADIRHLLAFVGNSGCTFIRNGEPHDAKSAAEHLAMKYGKTKSRLATAEQFIDAVASRSYFTGTPYRVECPAQAAQESAAWLRKELTAWRAQATTASRADHLGR